MTSTSELIKYFLKQWKLIITIALICTGLFAGIMWLFCDHTINASEGEEIFYGAQAELLREYIETDGLESLDMNANYRVHVTIENISEDEAGEDIEVFSDELSGAQLNAFDKEKLLEKLEYYVRMSSEPYAENVTILSAAVFGCVVGMIIAVSAIISKFSKKES